MVHDIDTLNDEMVEKGVRVFVGGFQPPELAKTIRIDLSSMETTESSGLYINTDEFVNGFWVLEVSNEEEAIEWGRKAAKACRANVEVRPFH